MWECMGSTNNLVKYRQGTAHRKNGQSTAVHQDNASDAAFLLVYKLMHCGYLRLHIR